jgi:hypothetical protein
MFETDDQSAGTGEGQKQDESSLEADSYSEFRKTLEAQLVRALDGADFHLLTEAGDKVSALYLYRLVVTCITALQEEHPLLGLLSPEDVLHEEESALMSIIAEYQLDHPDRQMSVLHSEDAQRKKQALLELLDHLPQDLVVTAEIRGSYKSDSEAPDPYDLERLFDPTNLEALRSKIQSGEPLDDALLAILYDSLEALLDIYRHDKLFPSEGESTQLEASIVQLPLSESNPDALEKALEMGVDPELLLTKESIYPIPVQFFAGVERVGFQPTSQLSAQEQAEKTLGTYKKDEIRLYVWEFEKGEREGGDLRGLNFDTAQEQYESVVVHEGGHNAHERIFTFEEKIELLQAQRTDRSINGQEFYSYIEQHAQDERHGRPAMEGIAVGFEFLRTNPGLFSIVAPHFYERLLGSVVQHAPAEEQEELRNHIERTGEEYLARRIAAGETVESIRRDYFKKQTELLYGPTQPSAA